MEDSRIQTVILKDRKNLSINEVIDVDSFNFSEILIKTNKGFMSIKGKELHVKRLNLEKNEIDIDGVINSIEYLQKAKEEKESFFKRIFK